MPRTQIVPVALLLLAAFGLLFWSIRTTTIADQGQDGLSPLPPQKVVDAPDWTLTDIVSGRPVRLSDEARQHPVVFSFWATWCGPCHMELPHLERLSRKYRGRVAFYGVNSSDPPPAIADYAKRNGLTFPQLSDASRQVAADYGVDGIPLLVVVDTQNHVRAVESGYDINGDLEASLSKLLDGLLSER